MPKIVCFTTLLLLAFACSPRIAKPTFTKPQTLEVGYLQTYDSLPKIRIAPSSQDEFEQATVTLTEELPTLEGNDSLFWLPVQGKKRPFKRYGEYPAPVGYAGNALVAFDSHYDLYAIEQQYTSESMGFGEMLLLDSLYGHQYKIVSIGDGAVASPLFSPKKGYLLYYYNYMYEDHNAYLAICKVNAERQPEGKGFLQAYASYESSEWAVEEIHWLDEQTLVLQGVAKEYDREVKGWVSTFSYWKVHVPVG